jgi:hypothetical protein
MSKLGAYELEGRLNGIRAVLAVVVGHLLRSGGGDLRKQLEARISLADQQEDPGAVPEPSFAVEAAAMREIELLLGKALALCEAQDSGGPTATNEGIRHGSM